MKKRYIFAGVLLLISLPSVAKLNIVYIIQDLGLLWTLYIINDMKKDGNLSGNEKAQILITEIVSPIIAGAFYYYCWKNQFPKKAKEANKYSWIIVLIEIVVILAASFLIKK